MEQYVWIAPTLHRIARLFFNVEDTEIDGLFLNAVCKWLVDNLVKQLAELDAVTKKLQRDHATARSARTYFDPYLGELFQPSRSSRC